MKKEDIRILDEELSKGEYVTYNVIAGRLITDPNDTVALRKCVSRLKKHISRDSRLKGVLDYKNKKNGRVGLKYKPGYENYLKYLEAKKDIEKMSGIEKIIYSTIGLDLLLDQRNTECTKIEFECVRNLKKSDYVKEMAIWIL